MFGYKNAIMLEELKNKVKSRAGIYDTSPADCKKIADDIFENTQKKISVTTLKRFFGFASIKHKLSKYTLTALTEYIESDCIVVLNTKINPANGKVKDNSQIQFDLHDGSLQLGNCINIADLDNIQESEKKVLPIKIKLTKNQVKDVVKSINKKSK
jgi:hypothetical protein